MVLEEELQPLLQKAFFYLKFRQRTRKEVENYLLKKIKTTHWSTNDVEIIILHLEELDLLDDKKFINSFVEDRILLKPKSEFALKQELLKHGIDKELIEEHFSNNTLNEEELAEKILQERWRRYENLDKRIQFEKAASFLMRRGFNFDIAKKTIDKVSNNKQ